MGSSHSSPRFVIAANDYQLVIEASKELEFVLEHEFRAEGKGLHEKVSGAASYLAPPTIKSLRYVASVRNALVHDRSVTQLENRALFILKFESALEEINVVLAKRQLDTQGRNGRNGGGGGGHDGHASCLIM